ncbi:hypothetical protein HMI55_001998 [Coelomomyces lativittatus]|nr:hypothetical protein HMI55_001998 [Coelomomyces lativittatus]
MLIQYLNDEGFHASKITLQDETNIRLHEQSENQLELRRLKKAILDGDWQEVDKLISKPLVKNHKAFLYAIYKQQYLEYIEYHEIQKAFTFLNKRMKPLEHLQTTMDEFKDLCYLLTGKSVHDAPTFKHWEGIGPGREKLVEQLQTMMYFDQHEKEVYVPPNRLVTLLKQAATYQVGSSRYHPKTSTPISRYFRIHFFFAFYRRLRLFH